MSTALLWLTWVAVALGALFMVYLVFVFAAVALVFAREFNTARKERGNEAYRTYIREVKND